MTTLMLIDFKERTGRRYLGKTNTHAFLFNPDKPITEELIERMRLHPDQIEVADEGVGP